MPNHVRNYLTIHGPVAEVACFVAAARGRHPKPGDMTAEEYGKAKEEPFCFHSLVPLPSEYTQYPYGDSSERSGFNLEVEAWGIKWGAYRQQAPVTDPSLVTYAFTTPWKPPTSFLGKVTPKWPALLFLLSWGGGGPTRGRATFRRGNEVDISDEPYRREDYPQEEDFASDNEYWRHYEEAEHRFLTGHSRWVLSVAAIGAGKDFPPPDGSGIDPLADWATEQGYERHVRLLTDAGPLKEKD